MSPFEPWLGATGGDAQPVDRWPTVGAFAKIADLVGSSIAPDGLRGWRLRPRGGAIELMVDRRLLAPESAQRRLVGLASGAALFNLRRALAHDDRQVLVEMTPGPADVLARVRPVRSARVDNPADPRLHHVTSSTMRALTEAATAEGGVVIPLSAVHAFLLAARDDTVEALVASGQALQRMVIEAAARSVGVSLSFAPDATVHARRSVAAAGSGAVVPQALVEFT